MPLHNADIISQLQRDILSLQGFKNKTTDTIITPQLGPINSAFPNKLFPLASIHEFLSRELNTKSATSGFIAHLLATIMKKRGVAVWIHSSKVMYPPALKLFGVEPQNVIFITACKEKEKLWLMEEALKCEGLAAAVAEIRELDFISSRRLQLAVEKSRVTGFAISYGAGKNMNACTARWKISSLPSKNSEELPGIGFPCWKIELLKIRNGRPGAWKMQLMKNQLHPVAEPIVVQPSTEQLKTG